MKGLSPKRSLLAGSIGLLLAGVLTTWLMLSPSGVAGPVHRALPSFELPVLGQMGMTLHSHEIRDKVTVLNVWASWCLSCRIEHPLLMEISKDKNLRLYGLNHRDNSEDAMRWIDYYGDPYSLSLADSTGSVGKTLGLHGVPETYVIDKNGKIRLRHVGALTEEEWLENMAPLIHQLAAEP